MASHTLGTAHVFGQDADSEFEAIDPVPQDSFSCALFPTLQQVTSVLPEEDEDLAVREMVGR
jgi:hypothetical protein